MTCPSTSAPRTPGSPTSRGRREIVDRQATELLPALTARAADPGEPVAARAGSLWALEGLSSVPVPLLEALVADASPDLRHEAIRIAGTTCTEGDFRRLAEVRIWDRARPPDTADLRIPAPDIAQAGFTGISIMPEGLLEAMTPEDVADLFAYLQALTAGPPSR